MIAAKRMRARDGAIARREPAARRRGDLRDQSFRQGPRRSSVGACARSQQFSAAALAAFELRLTDATMKRIRFWGTRGSLPVALTAADVRGKLVAALRGASGRDLRARPPRSSATSMASRSTSPARTADTRPASRSRPAERITCSAIWAAACARSARRRSRGTVRRAADLSRLHVARALGPHHGAAVLHAGLHSRQPHPHLRRPRRRSRRRCAGRWTSRRSPCTSRRCAPTIEFVHSSPTGRHEIAGMTVTAKLQRHGGDSYGYRFERSGRAVVYSTDSEHKLDDSARDTRHFVAFFRDADVVIFDAMYSLADADFGQGRLGALEQCRRRRAVPAGGGAPPVPVPSRAGARRRGDRRGAGGHAAARGNHANRRAARVTAAYDGMEIAL